MRPEQTPEDEARETAHASEPRVLQPSAFDELERMIAEDTARKDQPE